MIIFPLFSLSVRQTLVLYSRLWTRISPSQVCMRSRRWSCTVSIIWVNCRLISSLWPMSVTAAYGRDTTANVCSSGKIKPLLTLSLSPAPKLYRTYGLLGFYMKLFFCINMLLFLRAIIIIMLFLLYLYFCINISETSLLLYCQDIWVCLDKYMSFLDDYFVFCE